MSLLLRHIILIPSQPVFALSPYCYVLSREATNTNFIAFGLTRSMPEPTIYHTGGYHTNHYTTDAVAWEHKQTMYMYLNVHCMTIFVMPIGSD